MTTVYLNGERYDLEGAKTVAALLLKLDGRSPAADGASRTGIAVAVNGQVVLRREWEQTPLADGDDVRLVRAVAGGAPVDAFEDPEPLVIAGRRFESRLFVGTGRFI